MVPKKVMVGMSGGVDSAVAALLLKNQGYDVAGGTFELFDSDGSNLLDAKSVCDTLKIPHYTFDFKDDFRREVLDFFADEYTRGSTPNPCVLCNRTIKFGAFLKKAQSLGFDFVSTGHYAHVCYDNALGRFRIRRADSLKKDQSYVLFSLTQEQLKAILLPLGGCEKPQIRKIAEENGLIVSKKGDSQDICFIPDGNYALFLKSYLNKECAPGNFIDGSGKILGRHNGVWHYTIGQRKGLNLSFGSPMYVSAIDACENTVTLSGNSGLMRDSLTAENVNWIDFDELTEPTRMHVKIRYGGEPAPAVVKPNGKSFADVLFDEPQRAVTRGQYAVFYNGGYLVGGGKII